MKIITFDPPCVYKKKYLRFGGGLGKVSSTILSNFNQKLLKLSENASKPIKNIENTIF